MTTNGQNGPIHEEWSYTNDYHYLEGVWGLNAALTIYHKLITIPTRESEEKRHGMTRNSYEEKGERQGYEAE